MYNIGIMQGRLSPPQGDRFQFFPNDWEKEFQLARELGFNSLEWLVDWDEFWENPVWYLSDAESNLSPIRKIAENYGITIGSACFDYLMKYTLFERNYYHNEAIEVFQRCIPKLAKLGVKIITLAFLEGSAIHNEEEKWHIRNVLNSFRIQLEKHDIDIAIETEMPGGELSDYIDSFNNSHIGVCYDTGNCITMGHDLSKDIRVLGSRIKEVHIKDRRVGSVQSVYLGTGDVDFDDCFRAFKSIKFNGPYILQAWREADYLGDAKMQLEYVKAKLRKTEGGR